MGSKRDLSHNCNKFDEKTAKVRTSLHCDDLHLWLIKTGSKLKSYVSYVGENKKDENSNSSKEDLQQTLLQFTILLPLAELLDYNVELWNMAVMQPQQFCNILTMVIYDQVLSTGKYGVDYEKLHVQVNPKFDQLPNLPEYIYNFSSRWTINLCEAHGLLQLSGFVVAKSLIVKFTQFATYTCPHPSCDLYKHTVKTCVSCLGSSESDIVRNDLTCPACEECLEEMIPQRILGERILLKVCMCKRVDAISNTHNGVYSHLITTSVKGPFDDNIEIGKKYLFTGVFVKEANLNWYPTGKQTVISTVFDVSHTKELKETPAPPQLTLNIARLFKDRKQSAWSFAASLAYCFAASLCPNGIFNEVKLCLLLSLVMMNNSPYSLPKESIQRLGLSLLICDKELSIIQELMNYASTFDVSRIALQNGIDIDGQFTCDDSQSGIVYLEGGALALAGNGVCLIPNLCSIKKPVQDKLQKALELGYLPISLKRKLSNDSGYNHVNLNANCSIWCAVASQKKNISSMPDIETDGLISKAFADQFSLVLRNDGKDDDDNEIHARIADQIIEKSTEHASRQLLLSRLDFESVINCARQLPVSMSKNVYNLLNTFYLSSRRIRGTSVKGTEMSRNALRTLLSLAVAHTKLSLRTEVLIEDATVAILLYENSISRRYGSSVLGISSSPHIKNSEIELCLGPQNDARLRLLQNHVINFCKSHISTTSLPNSLVRCEE